jgi:polyisoprenoid-binding protein YceI
MKRLALVAGILSLAAPFALAQTATWVPDRAHSEVNFTILHMSLSNVRGRFGNIGGKVVLDQSDITKSSVQITVDASTVDTGVEARDADLKSSSFFDVEKFPTATFTSTSVSRSGDHLTVNGNLTLHGVTRPVVLDVTGPTGPISGMDHKPHVGFSATTTIDRLAFGIGSKYPTSIIGDQVKLTIDMDVAKQ